MSEDNKKEIKTIDFNQSNFFEEKESHFAKTSNLNKEKDSFLTKLVIIAIIISFCIVGCIVLIPFEKMNAPRVHLNGKETQDKGNFDLFKKRENILFLGVDSNGEDTDPFEKTRTDTIMIVSLDKDSKSANIVSIPRDSKVYIDGHGIDKINSAHALGGIDLTLKTVQNMFGVKIDHYVMVNYDGLKAIVEVLDTVPIYIEKDMYYNDYAGKLHINLKAGKQNLNAEQVEQYARFRHDAVGDIGRMERQRTLIQGILTKLQSPESISKIPDVISVANKYIKTDMTIFDMTRYAGVAKNVKPDNITMATLPGHPSQNSYISYWILEPDKAQSIIDKLIYRIESHEPQTEPLKISLLYNKNISENLETIKTTLQDHNMEIVCEKETKKAKAEIIAHKNTITTTKYKYIKTVLPELKKAHMSVSYDLFYCAESDATIVITK